MSNSFVFITLKGQKLNMVVGCLSSWEIASHLAHHSCCTIVVVLYAVLSVPLSVWVGILIAPIPVHSIFYF